MPEAKVERQEEWCPLTTWILHLLVILTGLEVRQWSVASSWKRHYLQTEEMFSY